MTDNLLLRVILISTGETHIVFHSKDCIACTPQNLLAALSNPIEFYEKDSKCFAKTTHYVNPRHRAIQDVPGITLLSITKDKTVSCEFPEIFQCLSDHTNNKLLMFKDFAFKDQLTDEKQFLLNLFFRIDDALQKNISFDRHISLSPEKQTAIIREILNTVFSKVKKISNKTEDAIGISTIIAAESNTKQDHIENIGYFPKGTKDSIDKELKIPEGYVSPPKYAEINNVSQSTVYTALRNGRLHSFVKIGNRTYMDPNEKLFDGRKGRKVQADPITGRKNFKISKKDYCCYEITQEQIKNRKLFTDIVRPFIRTYYEALYYKKNRHKEVYWGDFVALIIDIKPDQIIDEKGTTNRKLIQSGAAPVVPTEPTVRYHLHHIGQRKNSPLAIIREDEHNGKEMYSYFHYCKESNDELHGEEFRKQKQLFWNTYLDEYDKAREYSRIVFHNSPHTKHKR